MKRFNNFRNPIAEGYYSKLDSLTSGRAWTPRQAGSTWQDINRPSDDIILNIEQIEQWRDRIDAAISSGAIENVCVSLKYLIILPHILLISLNFFTGSRGKCSLGYRHSRKYYGV